MVIQHICQDCGKQFPVEQGSRRRYCDACLVKRIMAGRKNAGRKREGKPIT